MDSREGEASQSRWLTKRYLSMKESDAISHIHIILHASTSRIIGRCKEETLNAGSCTDTLLVRHGLNTTLTAKQIQICANATQGNSRRNKIVRF